MMDIVKNPIGRIRFLDVKRGGDLGGFEFSDITKVQEEMERSVYYGAPFLVMIYENAPQFNLCDHIDTKFLRGVASVPDFMRIPVKQEFPSDPLEQAKYFIRQFCEEEYNGCSEDTFDDLTAVGLGYTTVTDEEIPIQAYADLINFSIERYLCDTLIECRKYGSLKELIENELCCLDADELVSVSDEDLALIA